MRDTRSQLRRKKAIGRLLLLLLLLPRSSSSWALVDGKRKTIRDGRTRERRIESESVHGAARTRRQDVNAIQLVSFRSDLNESEVKRAPKERHNNPVRKRRNSLTYPTKKEVQPNRRPRAGSDDYNSSTRPIVSFRLFLSRRVFSAFARRLVRNRRSTLRAKRMTNVHRINDNWCITYESI